MSNPEVEQSATNADALLPVTQEAREAAWPLRPYCYTERHKKGWMAGTYDDAARVIGGFAAFEQDIRHRISSIPEAQGDVGETLADLIRQLQWVAAGSYREYTKRFDVAEAKAILAALRQSPPSEVYTKGAFADGAKSWLRDGSPAPSGVERAREEG